MFPRISFYNNNITRSLIWYSIHGFIQLCFCVVLLLGAACIELEQNGEKNENKLENEEVHKYDVNFWWENDSHKIDDEK